MSQPASFPPQRGGASQPSPTTVTPAPQAAVEAPEPGASETAATSSSPVLTVSSPEPPAVPGGEKKDTKVKKAVAGPRRVKLSLTHVDPWSVMKVSFMMSVAAGIMLIVAAAVVWFVLDAMHVFSTIQDLVAAVMDKQSNSFTALVEYLKFSLQDSYIAQWSDATSLIPATTTAAALTTKGYYGEGEPLQSVIAISQTEAKVRPVTPAYPVISQVFEKNLADLINGTEPQKTLDQMVSEIDADIKSAGYNNR